MLAHRTIHFQTLGKKLHQSVIPREVLADCGRAEVILERAQKKALSILERAEQEREYLRTELQKSFIRDAEACLQQWEEERLAMWENIEQYASKLSQAVIRELLDELSEEQKIKAMVLKFSQTHIEPISATLQCPPCHFDILNSLLQHQPKTPWRPVKNAKLKNGELCLVTDIGEFMISWEAILEILSAV